MIPESGYLDVRKHHLNLQTNNPDLGIKKTNSKFLVEYLDVHCKNTTSLKPRFEN